MKKGHEIKGSRERMPRGFRPVNEEDDEEDQHDELREDHIIQLQDMMRYRSSRSPPAHHHQHDHNLQPHSINVVSRRRRRKGIPRRAPLGYHPS